MTTTWTEPWRPTFPVATAPTWPLVGAAIGVGVLADQAVRAGVIGLATPVLVAATTAILLGSGRVVSRESRLLVGAAPLFAMWVMFRTSPWLAPLDLLTAFGLLLLGCSVASGGTLTDTRLGQLGARAWHAVGHFMWAGVWPRRLVVSRLSRSVAPAHRRLRSMVVGAAVAVPVVIGLGALLASADAVFASIVRFHVPWDGAHVGMSVVLIALGTWTMLGFARVASAEAPEALPLPRWRLGRLEFTIVLVAVDALFALFTVAQLVALSGAGDRILRTAGLSYADYARSGFFQLLWVAGLTIAGLLALRAAVDHDDAPATRHFRWLALIAIGLTVLIVAAAVRRLMLYEHAYGLTMLRLYSLLFAAWIGAALALFGAEISGVGGHRSWFPAAAGGCALAILFTLNAVNPEAAVVRHNLNRDNASVPIDAGYLTDLSDDAVPTLAGLLPRLDPSVRGDVVAQICTGDVLDVGAKGPAAWNLSRARAHKIQTRLCPNGLLGD
ncbi:MAG TPA: DUF4173 domain-containing protein [Acidimicrobiales bacterium]|nr:DUF4173 domain-containing protein [Acidimicrobiales bacterium]